MDLQVISNRDSYPANLKKAGINTFPASNIEQIIIRDAPISL